MRDQAGEKGETGEAKAETGTGKATVRQNREEKERKNKTNPITKRNKMEIQGRIEKVLPFLCFSNMLCHLSYSLHKSQMLPWIIKLQTLE